MLWNRLTGGCRATRLLAAARRTAGGGLGLLLAAGVAHAGGSAPVLSATEATAMVSAAGVRSVRLVGSFNFDDLLQFSYPAGLLVTQGSHFVRYDVSGRIVEGDSELVADGVDATEIPALLAAGGDAAAPAALARIQADRITVVLPADVGAGVATAALYADYDGGSWVSNPVSVTLP